MALYRDDDPSGSVGDTRGGVRDLHTEAVCGPYNGSGPPGPVNYDCHTETDGVGSIATRMSGTGPEG